MTPRSTGDGRLARASVRLAQAFGAKATVWRSNARLYCLAKSTRGLLTLAAVVGLGGEVLEGCARGLERYARRRVMSVLGSVGEPEPVGERPADEFLDAQHGGASEERPL